MLSYQEFKELPLIDRIRTPHDQIPIADEDSFGNKFKKYFLLHKAHYETGVNYLCVTKSADPYKYNGSGRVWKKLLKKIQIENIKRFINVIIVV